MHYIDGKMLKALREKRNMTQTALAERLHVSDKAISKWETGRGFPDISILDELAKALQISVVELLAGDQVKNENVCANMRKSLFYVCPVCGNVIHSVGEGVFSCHGIVLPPLEAEEAQMEVTCVENEYVVSLESPMRKDDYISFMAYVTSDSTQIIKLYPEQTAEARFIRRGHGMIYAYEVRNGLYQMKI